MRWTYIPPTRNAVRRRRRFLLLPRTMILSNGHQQTRWLTLADLVWVAVARDNDNADPWIWKFKGFADELLLDKVEGNP